MVSFNGTHPQVGSMTQRCRRPPLPTATSWSGSQTNIWCTLSVLLKLACWLPLMFLDDLLRVSIFVMSVNLNSTCLFLSFFQCGWLLFVAALEIDFGLTTFVKLADCYWCFWTIFFEFRLSWLVKIWIVYICFSFSVFWIHLHMFLVWLIVSFLPVLRV